MGLYESWEKITLQERSRKEHEEFWADYFAKEKNFYGVILEDKDEIFEGTIKEFSEKYEQDILWAIGFLDGINTSLVNELDIENLEEDTKIKLEIDFEKLFYNMHEAKAEWLYTLPQWEDILTLERRLEIAKEYRTSQIAVREKLVGRNDPCVCGSGKKYKKCCGK